MKSSIPLILFMIVIAGSASGEQLQYVDRYGRTHVMEIGESQTAPPSVSLSNHAVKVQLFEQEGGDVSESARFEPIIAEAAERYSVSADLLRAVIKIESNFNPRAKSAVGAQGLMQLMPVTARELGVTRPFDARENVMGGAKYLGQLLRQFSGDTALALAAYNAGPARVTRLGRVPKIPETRSYVRMVMHRYYKYVSQRAQTVEAPPSKDLPMARKPERARTEPQRAAKAVATQPVRVPKVGNRPPPAAVLNAPDPMLRRRKEDD